tara:strand:- start:68 stop:331 length:264 start_codon:yes stop_codon:yes gene_type:complete
MHENTKDFADLFLYKEPRSEEAQKFLRAGMRHNTHHQLKMVPDDLARGYVSPTKNVTARGFKRAQAKRDRGEIKRTRSNYKANGFGS